MAQGKDDFAYDLAFEILYGGDRFDQNDLAYAIGSLMKREDVEGFRDSVRESIARITAEKRDKLPSVDFVESQLKSWVPDDIVEQGALLCKYRDEGKGGPEFLCAEGNCVFSAHSMTADGIWDVSFVDKDGKDLVGGVFQSFGRDNKDYCIDPVEGTIVLGLSSKYQGGVDYVYDSLVQLDMVTKECKKWPVSHDVAKACRESFVKEGFSFEVLQAACSYAAGEERMSGDQALLSGCREWDVEPEVSKGLKV